MTGCIESFLGKDVENTPENNYEVFWQDLDRYYALFGLKGVNWDSLYTVYRPQVSSSTEDAALLEMLCAMITPLRDAHVVVQAPERTCISTRPSDEDDLNLAVVERFLEGNFALKAGGRLKYGRIAQSGKILGYVYIENFEGDGAPVAKWVGEMDDILAELAEVDALILDVRTNRGGNGFNAAELVGRFTDVSRPYLVTQTRNGIEHDDFTAPRTWYIEPNGRTPFLKPVVCLTNERTFSAAEWFILGMRTLPHSTVIGTNTGGGLSSRLFRTLPNGWSFSISIQRAGSPDGAFYEGIGIEPDIYVSPSQGAVIQPDTILRRAIEYLIGR